MPRLQLGTRATLLGMVANAVLAVVKMATGVVGHSHALIADGVESLADLFASAVVWRGLVVASTPPDADHPYGHGKAEPIATAVVAGILLLASVWIAVHAAKEIITPHLAPEPFTLAVLILVVGVKEALFRFVRSTGEQVNSSAVRADAWHHRSDAITSLAALVGISVALLGGKGYESADDVAAVFAAGIIARNGWMLLRPALDELMDASPSSTLADQIRQVASQTPGVERVEKCLVRKMGYEYLVDMHLEVHPEITVRHAHGIAHQVKDRVRAALPFIRDVLVHVEPAQARASDQHLKR